MSKRKIKKEKSKRPRGMSKNEWMQLRDRQAKREAKVKRDKGQLE